MVQGKMSSQKWLAKNELGISRILQFIFGLFSANIAIPSNSNTSKNSIEGTQQKIQSLHVLICILMSLRDPNADLLGKIQVIFGRCCVLRINMCIMVKYSLHLEGTNKIFIQQLKKVLESMQKSPSYFIGKMSRMHEKKSFK